MARLSRLSRSIPNRAALVTEHCLCLLGRDVRSFRLGLADHAGEHPVEYQVVELISADAGDSRRELEQHLPVVLRVGLGLEECLEIRDGDSVRVRSLAGEVIAEVSVGDEMMPGVVSLPHGFGHVRPGVKLAVATTKPGVCSNLLTDEGPLDVPSNTHVANGIPVEVEALH